MDLIRELNYTCNSDIFSIVFAMKTSLPNRDDRNRVTQWLHKIMKNNKTLSDLKLRNEFLQSLKQHVQNGKLQTPFNVDPPKAALKALARQLPGHDENLGQDDEDMAMLRFLPAKHGGFLLPKPLPSIGAYVYIAASSQGECFRNIKWKNCRATSNSAYVPTTAEHIANVLTHGIWVVPSILGFFTLIKRSQNIPQLWAGFVYGVSLILIFTVSTSFHCSFFCNSHRQLRDFLHRCDRAVIYIFIAASYFPWLTLRSCPEGTIAYHLSWIIWVLALGGICYQQIFHERYKKLETFFYIFMGVAPALTVLNNWSDFSGFREIQLGGFIYGVGIIFFKLDGSIPCAHAIWHLFVAAAAGVHYRAIVHHLYPATQNDKNTFNEKLDF